MTDSTSQPSAEDIGQHLDRILLEHLRTGKYSRVAGDQVVTTDIPVSLLEVARKRCKDLGVSKPGSRAEMAATLQHNLAKADGGEAFDLAKWRAQNGVPDNAGDTQ